MFRPEDYSCFRFTSRSFDAASGLARFGYALDNPYEFCEELRFEGAPFSLEQWQRALLDRLLPFLHLAAGVSYYKTAVPREITVESGPLSDRAAAFFDSLYLNGLGEFAFRNGIPLGGRIRFPGGGVQPAPLPAQFSERRCLVPMGGGKDSLVTVEIMRRTHRPVSTFVLGDFPVIDAVCRATGLPAIRVSRRLDPLVMQLNREGALNGHVPISAIFSFSALFAAVLHHASTVVASQERSANVGNVEFDGREVNHQYSKSFHFEKDLQSLIRNEVSLELETYSLLRPLSEAHIAKLFAGLERYHRVFTSCNRSFRLSGPGESLWCGDCPKCRFVFLALAPFLQRRELLAIFGKDLFADERQTQGFLDILGLGEMKPFECVGEFEEARWCLRQVASRTEWGEHSGLAALWKRAAAACGEAMVNERLLFTPSEDHAIPEDVRKVLDEYL